jgi:hypothetical protein
MSKSKIDKVFIDKAIDIRKEYLKCIRNINIDNDELKNCTIKLQEIIDNGDESLSDIENKDSIEYKEKYEALVDNIVETIKRVENDIKPYQIRIEELQKESDSLYVSINERYPELTVDDIKEQIIPYLPE